MNLKEQLKKVQAETLSNFINQFLLEKRANMHAIVEERTYNVYVQPSDFKNIAIDVYEELRNLLEANGVKVYDDFDIMVSEKLYDQSKAVLYFGDKPIVRFPIY